MNHTQVFLFLFFSKATIIFMFNSWTQNIMFPKISLPTIDAQNATHRYLILWPLLRCKNSRIINSVQFSSVALLYPTLCDPMNCSMPGLPVHHKLPEFTQTHAHRDGDAIQPSHPLLSPSPPAPNPSHHQGLFQWVKSSHEVAKVLEFQLHHQSFQWTPRTDLF